ncbi:hypothetical protein HMI55_003341 [Coelomomyces lativittatus]|nr:hypothetical protein HMI55_003341 [Coelomomyces lativittatus]
MARLPQQVKAKAGYSEETVDEEFDELVTFYEQFKDYIAKLKEDAQKFKKAVEAILNHQRTFAATFLDVQAPIPMALSNAGQSGSQADLLDDNQKIKRIPSDSDTANVVQLYISTLDQINSEIVQDLSAIDRRIVQPINDLQNIFRSVDKAVVKRGHKLLDYDRHRNELQKLKNSTTKDLKDDRKQIQLETNLKTASHEYTTISDALKAQLPQFLQLRLEFIGPCFQTLYFLQLKLYQALLKILEPVQKLQRYDFSAPILVTYERHKLEIDQMLSQLTLLKQKTPGLSLSSESNQDSSSPHPVASESSPSVMPVNASPSTLPTKTTAPAVFLPPSSSIPPNLPAPPVPSSATAPRYVVALFDFPGQQPDDLAFRVGDQILVLEATNSTNDWWKGQLNNKVGFFPANYVK